MADRAEPEIPQEPADGLKTALIPDADTLSTPEISAPMLDVHPPHESIHTWRSFFIHIVTIVIGLLIAVSLEQTVEFFHHRHQREQLEAALQRDGRANLEYIEGDIAKAQVVLAWALEQASALERVGPTGFLTLHHMPAGFIGSPDAGVWPSAKASGVANLLPASAQNWFEYLSEVYNETFVSPTSASGQLYLAYAALDQAIFGHATESQPGEIDVSTLTAVQRATAVECLRDIAERARTVMLRLVIYDAANEYILSTPLDQLDTSESGKRYTKIFNQTLEAHPAAKYVVGGY
jgi:hypothetical protein